MSCQPRTRVPSGQGSASATPRRALHGVAAAYVLWVNADIYHHLRRMADDGFDVFCLTGCLAFEYATIWNQVFQQVYIFFSLWLDIVKAFPGRFPYSGKFASAACDFLFPACVVPLNTIVMILFWSLYVSAPHLIENRGIMDRYLESWMNHCLHTNIIFISLLEIIICAPKFPTRKRAFITIVAGVLAYTVTATGCRLMGGPWAYPIIEIMFGNWITFIAFQAFCIAIGFAGYLAAERVNDIFHGDQKKSKATSNGYHLDRISNGYHPHKTSNGCHPDVKNHVE